MFFRTDRLQELRKRKNISRKVLSELLGFSSDTIRKYESGERTPSLERLCIIAEYFEVSPGYFLEKDEHSP